MPWVIRDVVDDINKAVTKRWRHLDPLLPEPSDQPEGCMAPLLALGDNSRPSGLGVCRHQHVPADTLAQTWGTATKFVLSMRLRGPDVAPAADDLITQWRAHLAGQQQAGWTWLAERDGQPVALTVVEPPASATWIAGMTRTGATAYLQTMFVRPDERGGGIGAALVRHVHGELDARGIDLALLHYSQVNPLSVPFWHRMGYRPLWTTWEARPAATLR